MNLKRRSTILGLIVLSLGMELFAQGGAVVREPRSELDAMRLLLEKPMATYQDLADLIVVSRGEFSKYNNFDARRRRVEELEIFTFEGVVDPLTEPLSRGDLSIALHKSYDLDKGIMYTITSLGRYAHRDMQSLNILDPRFSEMDFISGGALMAVIDRADRAQKTKLDWAVSVTNTEENQEGTEGSSEESQ